MLTFREYLLIESAETMTMAPGNDIALSVNPRNINVAKIELSKKVKSDKSISINIDRDDVSNELKSLRGLYDIKSKKFWVWFAYESVHHNMIDKLKSDPDENIHLYFMKQRSKVGPSGVMRGATMNQHSVEEIKSWQVAIEKFVGKVSPLNILPFVVVGRK